MTLPPLFENHNSCLFANAMLWRITLTILAIMPVLVFATSSKSKRCKRYQD